MLEAENRKSKIERSEKERAKLLTIIIHCYYKHTTTTTTTIYIIYIQYDMIVDYQQVIFKY